MADNHNEHANLLQDGNEEMEVLWGLLNAWDTVLARSAVENSLRSPDIAILNRVARETTSKSCATKPRPPRMRSLVFAKMFNLLVEREFLSRFHLHLFPPDVDGVT